MSLLGRAAVVLWTEMENPAAHDEWHSHEHLPERVGIPGFLRGRRWIATGTGVPRHFVIYELQDVAVTTSAAYLERLNQPSDWTQRMMKQVRSVSRTLCRVSASLGRGIGAEVLTIRLTPAPGRASALREWLIADALPPLAQRTGLVGAGLLERDEATARPETKERELRRRPDDSVDWVILVEGYETAALALVADEVLSLAKLEERGAASGAVSAFYRLAHVLTPADLAESPRLS